MRLAAGMAGIARCRGSQARPVTACLLSARARVSVVVVPRCVHFTMTRVLLTLPQHVFVADHSAALPDLQVLFGCAPPLPLPMLSPHSPLSSPAPAPRERPRCWHMTWRMRAGLGEGGVQRRRGPRGGGLCDGVPKFAQATRCRIAPPSFRLWRVVGGLHLGLALTLIKQHCQWSDAPWLDRETADALSCSE